MELSVLARIGPSVEDGDEELVRELRITPMLSLSSDDVRWTSPELRPESIEIRGVWPTRMTSGAPI